MTLPAFKRSPTCPKCGKDNPDFDYKDAATVDGSRDTREPKSKCGWSGSDHAGEHIHLSCARCGYGKQEPWIMAVVQTFRSIGFRLLVDSTDALPE